MHKSIISHWLKTHENALLHFDYYDRFGSVYRIHKNIYGIFTKSPLHSADAWVYLVLGSEKALVIDTGFGIGDLRRVLQELAGELPLLVCNTHFHIDHALGNSQFDDIHISSIDAPYLNLKSFTEYSIASGRPVIDHSFYEEEDVIPYHSYRIHTFENHAKFQLGDCEIEAFHVPGHSPGEMVLLDRRDRILFSGDAVMYPFPSPLYIPFSCNPEDRELMNVTAFYRGLSDLMPHLEEFDFICDGHGLPLSPASVVEDMKCCAREIIEAPDQNYQTIHTYRGEARFKQYRDASIYYIPERV